MKIITNLYFDLDNFISKLILFGYWLVIAIVTIRILMKRRAVPSSLTWLLTVYLLPLIGIIAYLALGERYLGKRRVERARLMLPSLKKWINELKQFNKIFSINNSDVARPLFNLCELRQGIASVKIKYLNLLTSTDETLKSLIRDIQLARDNIKMVFYIWQPGGIANKVADALIIAAKRGVHCRLILDSAGSRAFFKSTIVSRMRNVGIEVVEALRVSLLLIFVRRLDLRQHRKIVLIDNHITYTGSMNIIDPRYFRQTSGVGQWIDLMVRMEGPVTNMMEIIFSWDWELETGQRIYPNHIYPLKLPQKIDDPAIQIIASGPGFPEGMIHEALLTTIYSARKVIILTTPYFVPSDDLLHAICIAAHRGVDVRLIIPRYNDSLLVGWASRALFSELLEAGVNIYLFEGGLLHTKSVQVDGQLSLIGTVNFDMRSLWLNFEIALVIDDNIFGKHLSLIQDNYIAHSCLLATNEWLRRPYWQRILERLCYFFSPLL
ncbi:MAG: cardiolipin synthase [Candidatus Dasytiphilus stammeri]